MEESPGAGLSSTSARVAPRSRVHRIAELLALTILFVVSLELTCRVEDWVEYRTPIFTRERSTMDLLIRDANGMHGRPNGRFQKWSLDSFGLRGPEVSRAKPPYVFRVATVGASETFGLYEAPGHEYPRQLEDSLNAKLAKPTTCPHWHAQVLNAAMPGMSLPTIDQDIRLRLEPLKPDFVVVYATPPAYLDYSAPVAAHPDSSFRETSELPWYYALSPRVAERLRTQLKSVLPTFLQDWLRQRDISSNITGHPAGWRFETVPTERLELFETDLRHLIGTIRSIGAIPVLMTHANRFAGSSAWDPTALRAWEKFYPRATGRTIVAFDSSARLTTIQIARDSQAVLIDLQPDLARSARAPFADFSHFTDSGAALVAEKASDAILTEWNRLSAQSCKG